jgi:hypothetical protein
MLEPDSRFHLVHKARKTVTRLNSKIPLLHTIDQKTSFSLTTFRHFGQSIHRHTLRLYLVTVIANWLKKTPQIVIIWNEAILYHLPYRTNWLRISFSSSLKIWATYTKFSSFSQKPNQSKNNAINLFRVRVSHILSRDLQPARRGPLVRQSRSRNTLSAKQSKIQAPKIRQIRGKKDSGSLLQRLLGRITKGTNPLLCIRPMVTGSLSLCRSWFL